jgi:phosphoglycerate dehydrogenase-like enzyme
MGIEPKSHQLLILSQDFEVYQDLIEQAGLAALSIYATKETGEALAIGRGCDLLFGEPALVSQVVTSLPRLVWVQTTWAGVEPLVTPSMRRDYLLTNARNVYGPLVSEYVFGYLLAIERQVLPRWQAQQLGQWDGSTPGTLRGKLLGLLGVGTIGAYLARIARDFNLHVFGYTRQSEACEYIDRYFHGDSWRDFASDLDFLVCTLPGTAQTNKLVDAERLSTLSSKTWFINVGRGSTVDEAALVKALSNESIAGAVLDVFCEEPLPQGHPLWSTPNTFITSHTAARNYLPDIANLFIENYKRLIAGQRLFYQVDFDQGY